MQFIPIVNQLLALLTIAGQLFLVALIVLLIIKRGWLFDFFTKRALAFSFLVAVLAILGSLFYSEIAGYEPCKLCWFQRILMYPQAIILGLAWLKKDYGIALYGIVLSAIGALIAAYHYLLQIGLAPALSCSAVGYSINCSQRFVMQFGYITISLMALTVFLIILSFMLMLKRSKFIN